MIKSFLKAMKAMRALERISKRFPTTTIEVGVVVKGDLDNLKLGKNVQIQSGVVLHLGGMEWCGREGKLEIGDNAVISPHCVLYGAGHGGITIGNDFDCGPGVGIFASRTDYHRGHNNHYFSPVEIGDRVIVYANAVIGPGVKVGEDSVIAAGSVVTKDVPSNTLVGGAPARVIKQLRL